jgi:hypothetical protein
MEYLRQIFFPKDEFSDEGEDQENSQDDNWGIDQENDLFEEASVSNQQVDLFEQTANNSMDPANVSFSPVRMMSESEVREMMLRNNTTIDQHSRQIEYQKKRSKDLEEEVLRLKRQTCRLEDQNREKRHTLRSSFVEKDKLELNTNIILKKLEDKNKKVLPESGEILKLRETLLQFLPDMIPDTEASDQAHKMVSDMFKAYTLTNYRLEKLKEENFDLQNTHGDQE